LTPVAPKRCLEFTSCWRVSGDQLPQAQTTIVIRGGLPDLFERPAG
jgi:hypothetical protein